MENFSTMILGTTHKAQNATQTAQNALRLFLMPSVYQSMPSKPKTA